MEDITNREFAKNDPKGFLNTYKNGVIIDEIQYVPEMFSYLQVFTDERNQVGEYIITGSQNFLLMEQISQSLAGRVALFTLLPFSYQEIKNSEYHYNSWEQYAVNGSYPRKITFNISASDYYSNYLSTYVERDVRLLKNITNLDLFQKFIYLLAGRVGQLFNQSNLGNELGIDNKTINAWMSLLETSYIAYRLYPYHSNFNKRIIKTPKIYFYDIGLLSYLLGIKNEQEVSLHFAKGGIFENLIITEFLKNSFNKGEHPSYYFWRDHANNEIDLLVENHPTIDIYEIKSSSTIKQDFFKGLNYFKGLNANTNAHLIYGGTENQQRTGVEVMGWDKIE